MPRRGEERGVHTERQQDNTGEQGTGRMRWQPELMNGSCILAWEVLEWEPHIKMPGAFESTSSTKAAGVQHDFT